MALDAWASGAGGMAFKVQGLKPDAKLVDPIQVRPRGAADSRVVTPELGVVLALYHVYVEGAFVP